MSSQIPALTFLACGSQTGNQYHEWLLDFSNHYIDGKEGDNPVETLWNHCYFVTLLMEKYVFKLFASLFPTQRKSFT